MIYRNPEIKIYQPKDLEKFSKPDAPMFNEKIKNIKNVAIMNNKYQPQTYD